MDIFEIVEFIVEFKDYFYFFKKMQNFTVVLVEGKVRKVYKLKFQ